MLSLDPTWLQLIVALASFGFMAYFFRRMEKKTDATIEEFKPMAKQLTPIVQNVMSNMGHKSANSKKLKEVEGLLAEDIQNGLLKMYPEFSIILEMISPATMDAIKENPVSLPILAQRYMPLINSLKGRVLGASSEKTTKFDY